MNFIIIFIILLAAIIGAPLFAVIGLDAIYNFHLTGNSILVVAEEIASKIVSVPMLYSIPLFTFAGYILASSKFSTRLVRLTKAVLGWMPGGLAIVTLVTCAFFTAFTGASGVTIVALGGFLLPALLSEKYEEKYSLGLVTTSGSLGLLFPPSLPIIIYGVVATVNIDHLFAAGILPGFFLILVLGLYAVYKGVTGKIQTTSFDIKEVGAALWDIKWEIPLPVLLIAGVLTGKLALSDAAPFTVGYVLIVEVLAMKDIKIKELPGIIQKSMIIVGAILLIMSVSFAATNYIVYQEIPQKIFAFMQGFITSKIMFLILLNVFLLFVGCIMDVFSALVVVVPLIYPIAYEYNVNLVHLGIIFLANLEIGYLTPPVGMNLFISSLRFKKPVVDLYKASVNFILLLIVSLFVITYVPQMSIWFLEKPSLSGKWEYADETTGMKDTLVLKAGGKYLRKQIDPNDLFSMMKPYTPGEFVVTNNKISLHTETGIEEYKYEIFNDGKRLLMKKLGESETENKRTFYINQITPPIGDAAGKLIGRWSAGDTTMDIYFNGRLMLTENAGVKEYIYTVKGGKLMLKDAELVSGGDYKIVKSFKYKIEKSGALLLTETGDGKSKYSLILQDSDSDL